METIKSRAYASSRGHHRYFHISVTNVQYYFPEIVDVGVSEQRKYWETLREEFLLPYESAKLREHREQLVHISNGSLLVFSLFNILWFIIDFGFLLANPLGFASLTVFTAILIIQFIAMAYHRLMTVSYELSQAHYFPVLSKGRRPQEMSSIQDSAYDRGQMITNASA